MVAAMAMAEGAERARRSCCSWGSVMQCVHMGNGPAAEATCACDDGCALCHSSKMLCMTMFTSVCQGMPRTVGADRRSRSCVLAHMPGCTCMHVCCTQLMHACVYTHLHTPSRLSACRSSSSGAGADDPSGRDGLWPHLRAERIPGTSGKRHGRHCQFFQLHNPSSLPQIPLHSLL